MSDERDASSSFVWPPTIYVSAFVLALALSWLTPDRKSTRLNSSH